MVIYIQINMRSPGTVVPICCVQTDMAEYHGGKDNLDPLLIVTAADGSQQVGWKGGTETKIVNQIDILQSRWLWDIPGGGFVLNPENDKVENPIDVFTDWEPV